MKLKRKFNNNAALVEDEHQLEYIVLGSGVAFNIKPSQFIDESKIDKKFVIESEAVTTKFVNLINDIPINQLTLVNKIINKAQKNLQVEFDESIYIAIADHINYAISRTKQGIVLKNLMLEDIRKFYPKAFEEAKSAVEEIQYSEGIELPEDEAAFIALHFVNAMNSGEDIEFITTFTEIKSAILSIIEEYFQISIDTTSLNYSRFDTHIKYLTKRILIQEKLKDSDDIDYLYNQVIKRYPEAYKCALEIDIYLENKFHISMSKDELIYFVIHIVRIIL